MTDDITIDALGARLACAYDLDQRTAETAVRSASTMLAGIAASDVSFERHAGRILLVHGGDVVAELDLEGDLPPIAPACDTLDPYGERGDVAWTTRIPPSNA